MDLATENWVILNNPKQVVELLFSPFKNKVLPIQEEQHCILSKKMQYIHLDLILRQKYRMEMY